MRNSKETKYRIYIDGYEFLKKTKRFGDKYVKILQIPPQNQENMLQKLLLKESFKKQLKQQEI